MKPNLENWSIVIVGSWNTKIFNPRWVAERLLGGKDKQVQIQIPIVPGFPTILIAGNIEIIPNEDSLTFRARDASDDTIRQLEGIAVATLGILEHTPVRAIGVNYGFRVDYVPEDIASLFDQPDEDVLSKHGALTQHQLLRALKMERGVMNLAITKRTKDVIIGLNFHLDLNYPTLLENADQAAGFLKENLLRYKSQALTILNETYSLTLEEEVAV